MSEELDQVENKLFSRIASKVCQEAKARGLHPMDFAELVADSIVSAACARVEVDPGARSDQIAGC